MNQPPAYPFPTSPAKTTADRLAHLPLLVAEILLTLGAGAPNPGERAGRGRRPKPGSKPPGSLDVVELTVREDDRPGSLVPLPRLVECSRLIWESLDDDEKADLGVPESPPTWRAECAWLERAWPTAQTTLDASVYEWVEDEIAAVYGQLCAMARLRAELPMVCTRLGCGNRAHLQPGNRWLVCEGGHTLDVQAERGRWLSSQDWTLNETHSALRLYVGTDVPLGSLKGWAARGHILPINNRRPLKYNFGAVCRFLTGRRRLAG